MTDTQNTTVLTWRPGNKRGVYVLRQHYEAVSKLIFSLLNDKQSVSLEELIEAAQSLSLEPKADVAYVLLQVKSDLQVKELIQVDMVGPYRKQIISKCDRRRTAA